MYVTPQMSKGRWKESDDQLAKEAYAVLVRREKPSRAYSKADLARLLKNHTLYVDFLKLCLEYDDSDDLAAFRRGLSFVVSALGPSEIARRAGFSRMSVYRERSHGLSDVRTGREPKSQELRGAPASS